MKTMKKLIAFLLSTAIFIGLMGCTNSGDKNQTGSNDLLDRATKLLVAEGRAYDKLYTGKMKETLANSFFEFSIDAATVESEWEGYVPQTEGYQFLVADVAVKNVFGESIPVGNYDFYILWNGGEDIAYEEFAEGMYPDEADLADGESLSGKLLFEVPADVTDIMIGYTEVWDDDFEGNIYLVEVEV